MSTEPDPQEEAGEPEGGVPMSLFEATVREAASRKRWSLSRATREAHIQRDTLYGLFHDPEREATNDTLAKIERALELEPGTLRAAREGRPLEPTSAAFLEEIERIVRRVVQEELEANRPPEGPR